jgi:hypothetical protein
LTHFLEIEHVEIIRYLAFFLSVKVVIAVIVIGYIWRVRMDLRRCQSEVDKRLSNIWGAIEAMRAEASAQRVMLANKVEAAKDQIIKNGEGKGHG